MLRRVAARLGGWLRTWWWAPLAVIGIAGALAFAGYLVNQAAPLRQDTALIADPKDRVAVQKDLLQYQLSVWTTFVQVIGAVALVVGGYVTWRNLRATQERLDLDRSAQITNRFTQAIGQLGAELKDGNPNLEIRLGGIYALERLSRDSPRDYWTIMEVLTAYVRQNSKREDSVLPPLVPIEGGEFRTVRLDIQAILTVLGRRVRPADGADPYRLDLENTDLRGANLRHSDLRGANLFHADLTLASLTGADLRGANLWEARLRNAIVSDANLQAAHLWSAHLCHATLDGSNLRGAYLHGADLTGTDLSRVVGLSQIQLEGVTLDETTKLPSCMQEPTSPAPADGHRAES